MGDSPARAIAQPSLPATQLSDILRVLRPRDADFKAARVELEPAEAAALALAIERGMRDAYAPDAEMLRDEAREGGRLSLG